GRGDSAHRADPGTTSPGTTSPGAASPDAASCDADRGDVVRVVVADDSMLIREGLSALLTGAGCEVVATAESGEGALREVALARPDVVVVDIRMPPTHTQEGIAAAHRIRRDHPAVGVLVLSQYLESE